MNKMTTIVITDPIAVRNVEMFLKKLADRKQQIKAEIKKGAKARLACQ